MKLRGKIPVVLLIAVGLVAGNLYWNLNILPAGVSYAEDGKKPVKDNKGIPDKDEDGKEDDHLKEVTGKAEKIVIAKLGEVKVHPNPKYHDLVKGTLTIEKNLKGYKRNKKSIEVKWLRKEKAKEFPTETDAEGIWFLDKCSTRGCYTVTGFKDKDNKMKIEKLIAELEAEKVSVEGKAEAIEKLIYRPNKRWCKFYLDQDGIAYVQMVVVKTKRYMKKLTKDEVEDLQNLLNEQNFFDLAKENEKKLSRVKFNYIFVKLVSGKEIKLICPLASYYKDALDPILEWLWDQIDEITEEKPFYVSAYDSKVDDGWKPEGF